MSSSSPIQAQAHHAHKTGSQEQQQAGQVDPLRRDQIINAPDTISLVGVGVLLVPEELLLFHLD